ncbi:hypothetical protein GF366_02350 [Candidatus Peregrinibacteria bacterium]|nr:hypothetical protein [Candidatus Peregrinibacteria bacterium]
MNTKKYNIDRKSAGKLLKVSTRTVDRYIKANKLSRQVNNGRVFLDKKEIIEFRKQKEMTDTIDNVDMSRSKTSIDNRMDNIDNIEVINKDNVNTVSTGKRPNSNTQIYKHLYNQLKEELLQKQERLEIANYRVGQLETQIKNSIPMLEFHREKYEYNRREDELQEKLDQQNTIIKRISKKLFYEKFSKRVFLIILLIIIALQPLWLLYIYK